MRYVNSIFGSLLKPLDRRSFQAIVDRHDGDAYDKSFTSWPHLVALIYTQLSASKSLRDVEAGFNAYSNHHYHLGVGKIARSTLADANRRRPVGIFAETFAYLSKTRDRALRREAAEVLRLIDASPIPLGELCHWATWNGRIRGMKMHVVYDPTTDRPLDLQITHANVNDVTVGRRVTIETGGTYVFDKGYCHYGWWSQIRAKGAYFITRSKSNVRWRTRKKRSVEHCQGDGFVILSDDEVAFASKGDSKLEMPLRRIRVKRDTGETIAIITNDMTRTAVEIATLYKMRWPIELLFRWLKQHLHIRKFLATNENAIKLQIYAALIAFLLLRIAARLNILKMPALRFAGLVRDCLFSRKRVAHIDKPPPVNPSKPAPKCHPNQLELCYA